MHGAAPCTWHPMLPIPEAIAAAGASPAITFRVLLAGWGNAASLTILLLPERVVLG